MTFPVEVTVVEAPGFKHHVCPAGTVNPEAVLLESVTVQPDAEVVGDGEGEGEEAGVGETVPTEDVVPSLDVRRDERWFALAVVRSLPNPSALDARDGPFAAIPIARGTAKAIATRRNGLGRLP